jgi:beta-glucosidase
MSASASHDPGESTRLSVHLPARAFAFWHPDQDRWLVEPGTFTIEVGPSANCLPLHGTVTQPMRTLN